MYLCMYSTCVPVHDHVLHVVHDHVHDHSNHVLNLHVHVVHDRVVLHDYVLALASTCTCTSKLKVN